MVVSVWLSVKKGVMDDDRCCTVFHVSIFPCFIKHLESMDGKQLDAVGKKNRKHLEELWLKSSLQKTSHSNSFEVFQKYGSLVMTSGFLYIFSHFFPQLLLHPGFLSFG